MTTVFVLQYLNQHEVMTSVTVFSVAYNILAAVSDFGSPVRLPLFVSSHLCLSSLSSNFCEFNQWVLDSRPEEII